MFTDEPLDQFQVASFDLDPERIIWLKKQDYSLSHEGDFLLFRIWCRMALGA